MNLKKAIRAILLLFVFGSVAYVVVDEWGGGGEAASPAASVDGAPFVVYFFSGDVHCATCDKLEAYAREAVETHFAEELASGTLAWRTLNMDAPENAHYITDFGLYSKSVVLVAFEDGKRVRWENLDRIWEEVYDKPAYLEYIRASLRGFLDAAP